MKLVPGEVYRRRDLHGYYGGQRQGGISTPQRYPIIFLFTGESGQQYGYSDGPRDDGSFWYTGEGQVGDMEMVRGNLAIRDHRENGKTLHLFEDVGSGRVRYVSEASYLGHHREVAPDREGDGRQAIVFELALSSDVEGTPKSDLRRPGRREDARFWRMSLEELRKRAVKGPGPGATTKQRKVNTHERSQSVRVYVLKRAKGTCEGCGQPAPFTTAQGRPYLEPHHIRRRADGGPDHPRWVAALCPNCHRRVHYGNDGAGFNQVIADAIAVLEGTLGT